MIPFWSNWQTSSRTILAVAVAIAVWVAGIYVGQDSALQVVNPQLTLSGLFGDWRAARVSLLLNDGDSVRAYPAVQFSRGQYPSPLAALQQASRGGASVPPSLKLQRTVLRSSSEGWTAGFSLDTQTMGERVGVVAVAGVRNTASAAWQYWVNGQRGILPANQYRLRPGDQLVWQFTRVPVGSATEPELKIKN